MFSDCETTSGSDALYAKVIVEYALHRQAGMNPVAASSSASQRTVWGGAQRNAASSSSSKLDSGSGAEFYYSSMDNAAPEEQQKWDVPSCFGGNIGPCLSYDTLLLMAQLPDQYNRLCELAAQRKNDVRHAYGLTSLDDQSLYLATHGPKSREMTDYFYQGFDAEGKLLLRLFYPHIAHHYGW